MRTGHPPPGQIWRRYLLSEYLGFLQSRTQTSAPIRAQCGAPIFGALSAAPRQLTCVHVFEGGSNSFVRSLCVLMRVLLTGGQQDDLTRRFLDVMPCTHKFRCRRAHVARPPPSIWVELTSFPPSLQHRTPQRTTGSLVIGQARSLGEIAHFRCSFPEPFVRSTYLAIRAHQVAREFASADAKALMPNCQFGGPVSLLRLQDMSTSRRVGRR